MQTESVIVRPAGGADVPSVHDIYRHYVERTIVSFEETVPVLDEFSASIGKSRK